MPSTDTKPELTAKASMAQPVSQPAVYANGLTIQMASRIRQKNCGLFDDRVPKYLLKAHAFIMLLFRVITGHAVAQFVEALLQPGRSRVRFPMVSLEIFIDIIF
jgi:hypothetical protein